MRLPQSVRIGGRAWKVKRSRKLIAEQSACGLCDFDTATISVATGQSKFDTKDTLLHETLHAILAQQSGWERTVEEEERYVLAIATGLTAVLQDNPEFAQYLAEPIPSPK